jgi:hypothetical protein
MSSILILLLIAVVAAIVWYIQNEETKKGNSSDSDQDSDQDPEQDSDQYPEQDSDQDPEQDPEQDPDQDPEQEVPLDTGCQIDSYGQWLYDTSTKKKKRLKKRTNKSRPEEVCPEEYEFEEITNADRCEVEYGYPSSCSKDCGPGVKTRKQEIKKQGIEGLPCELKTKEESCNEGDCVTGECAYTAWAYEECIPKNGVCGYGTKRKTRSVLGEQNVDYKSCRNETSDVDDCRKPCENECTYSNWTYGTCEPLKGTFGPGTKVGTRTVQGTKGTDYGTCAYDLETRRYCDMDVPQLADYTDKFSKKEKAWTSGGVIGKKEGYSSKSMSLKDAQKKCFEDPNCGGFYLRQASDVYKFRTWGEVKESGLDPVSIAYPKKLDHVDTPSDPNANFFVHGTDAEYTQHKDMRGIIDGGGDNNSSKQYWEGATDINNNEGDDTYSEIGWAKRYDGVSIENMKKLCDSFEKCGGILTLPHSRKSYLFNKHGAKHLGSTSAEPGKYITYTKN